MSVANAKDTIVTFYNYLLLNHVQLPNMVNEIFFKRINVINCIHRQLRFNQRMGTWLNGRIVA